MTAPVDRSARAQAACLASSLVLAAGCAQILGIEPWGAGGAGGGATAATSTGTTPARCADPAQLCLHPPSAGWSPIVALTLADTPCADAFATEVAAGKVDLAGDPAACSCNCDSPTGQSCGKASLDLYNESTCATKIGTLMVDASCLSGIGGVALNALGATVTPPQVVPGTCAPKPKKVVPPATFTVRHVCRLDAAGDACSLGGTCAPKPASPFGPALCIWAEGDRACPGGDFTNRTLVYRGPDVDTRDCDTCSCVPPTNAACSVSATVFGPGTCSAQKAVTTGPCASISPAGAQSASASISLSPGSCTPQGGAATGSLVGGDPVTVCCTNPLS